MDSHKLGNWVFHDIEQAYLERDTMLGRLGLGMGASPTDKRRFAFVYKKTLKMLPAMEVVRGSSDGGA